MRVFGLAMLAGGVGLAAGWRRGGALGIRRISRVVAELDRAAAFYCYGLGFVRVSEGPVDSRLLGLFGMIGGEEVVLRLGAEEVALVRFNPPGPGYPVDRRSDDEWFQHLAIVVDDMGRAMARLDGQVFEAISTGGPQRLPARNGGVVAFKFRDPDGHPLELIEFPPGQGRAVWHAGGVGPCLGIDHSALVVRETARSLRHYRRLGFRVDARSLNEGPAQARLDGLVDPCVRVSGLRARGEDGPGLELLGYRPPGRAAPAAAVNAIVTDWVTVVTTALAPGRAVMRRDPDGHLMLLEGFSELPRRRAGRW